MSVNLRVVVVEDEPPARRHLRALLEGETDVEVVGECGDGRTAVELIEREAPDVVFLDIEIPELSGIEVVEAIGVERMPYVVFVTAFNEYAVRAFDLNALDYLLKPFDTERFRRALGRVREQQPRHLLAGNLTRLLETLRPERPLERLAVKLKGRIRVLSLTDVDYLSAEGAYSRVHSGADSYLVRESISVLEERLDAARFARVHRSLIVNISRVKELEPLYRGEYVMWLTDGTRLVTGRTYRARVQQAFSL